MDTVSPITLKPLGTPEPESPFQQLICLGLASLPSVNSPRIRVAMLRAAAPHLPGVLGDTCEATAIAIEQAEAAQLQLRGLILS